VDGFLCGIFPAYWRLGKQFNDFYNRHDGWFYDEYASYHETNPNHLIFVSLAGSINHCAA
jgi:hypothetical protein